MGNPKNPSSTRKPARARRLNRRAIKRSAGEKWYLRKQKEEQKESPTSLNVNMRSRERLLKVVEH